MDIRLKDIPKTNNQLINEINSNLTTAIGLLQKTLPILKNVKRTSIPSDMTDVDLLNEWDKVNIPYIDIFNKMLSTFDRKDKINIIKYIAETDLSLKRGLKIGGEGGELVSNNNDSIDVHKNGKKVFINSNFIGSLISLIIGIYLLYLVTETLQGLNEIYELNITTQGLLTNFKGTIEFIPSAVLKAVSSEGLKEISYSIRRGCSSPTGNTLTTFLYGLWEPSDSADCIRDATLAGLYRTADITSREITMSLKMCWKLASVGTGFLGIGVKTMTEFLLYNKKTILALTDGSNNNGSDNQSVGGKRKTRKSKKTSKGKKGKNKNKQSLKKKAHKKK